MRFAVTDCYTGGTITVGEETLKERVPVGSSNNVFADGSSAVRVKMNSGGVSGPDTYVYIGGMGGSGFSASFTNFVNRVDSSDGQPTFNNCYTYMEFPDMEGTITGISLMGSTEPVPAPMQSSISITATTSTAARTAFLSTICPNTTARVIPEATP